MTVKMTPDTYSGVAVEAIEATDSVRSVREPSRMPARMPISSEIGTIDDHHPEHQDAGGAERRKQLRRDRRLELGRAAEIALQDAGECRLDRVVAEGEARRRLRPSPDR